MTWDELKEQLSIQFNVHPTTLHARYRFSSDLKQALLCDLLTEDQFNMMIKLLKPQVVPERTATGRRSTRKRKIVSVQIFNQGVEDSDNTTNKKLPSGRKVSGNNIS
jgi:hypothetical protein